MGFTGVPGDFRGIPGVFKGLEKCSMASQGCYRGFHKSSRRFQGRLSGFQEHSTSSRRVEGVPKDFKRIHMRAKGVPG